MYPSSLKFIIQILLVSLHLAYTESNDTQYGVDSCTLYFASAQEKLHLTVPLIPLNTQSTSKTFD